jgi:hypothetical protein
MGHHGGATRPPGGTAVWEVVALRVPRLKWWDYVGRLADRPSSVLGTPVDPSRPRPVVAHGFGLDRRPVHRTGGCSGLCLATEATETNVRHTGAGEILADSLSHPRVSRNGHARRSTRTVECVASSWRGDPAARVLAGESSAGRHFAPALDELIDRPASSITGA